MRCTRALLVFAALALNSAGSQEKTAEGAQPDQKPAVSPIPILFLNLLRHGIPLPCN